MTEAEWLATEDHAAILARVVRTPSARLRRLIVAAHYRAAADALPPLVRLAVEVLEGYADAAVPYARVAEMWHKLAPLRFGSLRRPVDYRSVSHSAVSDLQDIFEGREA